MEPFSAIFFRSCNFCGSQDFRLFRALDVAFPTQLYGDAFLRCPTVGESLKLQYLQCNSCGLTGVNPLTFFSDINLRSFEGEKDVVAWAGFDFEWYEQGKLDLARYNHAYLSLDRFRRLNKLLDVSCGPGVTLSWLAQNAGWQVAGVDPDRHSVRLARERYGLSIVNGLIEDLQEPNASFDVVWMDNSLEHTFDPLGTMLTAFRLLRPGGACVIFVPNGEALSVRYLDQHMYWGHWFLYSPYTLFHVLRRIGFSVVKLSATQATVAPELANQGIDIGLLHPALRVAVPGEERIGRVLSHTPCYSDFFTMMAIKPEAAPVLSRQESELRQIAAGSLIERRSVRIAESGSKKPSGDNEMIAGLDGRLVRRSDGGPEADKVFYVDNGVLRWVTSRSWLEERGFCFPDDVTPIEPALFECLPEGPAVGDAD